MSPAIPNRRQFIQQSAGVAASTTSLWVDSGNSARLLGNDEPAVSAAGGSRPGIGCIGTGDRWKSVVRSAMEFGDVLVVCDVDRQHREAAQQWVQRHQKRTPDAVEDYGILLQRSDIQVITIATPDHWHAKIAIEAMRAGKDVYCEKPLTLTIAEGREIIVALEQTGRVVQVGTQQRSEFEQRFLQAVALCRAGRLGKIGRVACGIQGPPTSPSLPVVDPPAGLNWDRWLGPAPWAEYRFLERENQRPATRCHYEFRWWYETSGGKMTDWGAHHVDIAIWACGLSDTGPVRITPKKSVHPVALDTQGMPTDSTRYNTATEFLVECEFENGMLLEITSEGPNGIRWEGDQGTLFASRQKLEGPAVDSLANEPLPAEFLRELYKSDWPRGPHAHMRNFFQSVTTRQQPISDVYSHHRAITICHLANIALRLGREIRWNPDIEQVIGDEEANAMQQRIARAGYEIA